MILLFLSLTTKLFATISLILSYSENTRSLMVSPMSLKFMLTMAIILHKQGVTKWYSFRYSRTSFARILRFFLLFTQLKALQNQLQSETFLQLSKSFFNSLQSSLLMFFSSLVTSSGIFSQIYFWNSSQKISAFSALSTYLAMIS